MRIFFLTVAYFMVTGNIPNYVDVLYIFKIKYTVPETVINGVQILNRSDSGIVQREGE